MLRFKNITFTHLLFLYAGFLIPVFIDVYIFSPFSAPTVTATTASITLLIAMITASKVNKWLDDKVKEKRFEKANEFYDDLMTINTLLNELAARVEVLDNPKHIEYENFKKMVGVITSKYDSLVEVLIRCVSKTEHFKGMKIKMAHKKALEKLLYRISDFSSDFVEINDLLQQVIYYESIVNDRHITKGDLEDNIRYRDHTWRKLVKLKSSLRRSFQSADYISAAFTKKPFEELFVL